MEKFIDIKNPKIVVAGAVGSTLRIIECLLRRNMNLVGIFGLDTGVSKNVSGFVDFSDIASKNSIYYGSFNNINDAKVVDKICELKPDILFIAGISQLAKESVMSIAKLNIGFHPTMLPEGRGRAPLAWITYLKKSAAATFFEISSGVDDGDIIAQVSLKVDDDDHADDVGEKLAVCIDKAMDIFCDAVEKGSIRLLKQDESLATYTGIRRPADGHIVWSDDVEEIYALIRASSNPHPGAFTYHNERKLVIMRAALDESFDNYRGVVGRVLVSEKDFFVVQTGTKPIKITKWFYEDDCSRPEIKVGVKLGLDLVSQIDLLNKKIDNLENKILNLTGEKYE